MYYGEHTVSRQLPRQLLQRIHVGSNVCMIGIAKILQQIDFAVHRPDSNPLERSSESVRRMDAKNEMAKALKPSINRILGARVDGSHARPKSLGPCAPSNPNDCRTNFPSAKPSMKNATLPAKGVVLDGSPVPVSRSKFYVEDSPLAPKILPKLHLLEGEKVMDTPTTNVTYVGPYDEPISGDLLITNYRLYFSSSEAARPLLFDVPLGEIKKIEKCGKVGSRGDFSYGIDIYCADMRNLRFACRRDYHSRRSVYETLQTYAFPKSHKMDVFAFDNRERFISDGWEVFNVEREFHRMGLPNRQWTFTHLNESYKLCGTYPKVLVVPSSTNDEELLAVASFRSRRRLPVLSWIDPDGQTTIIRCSQPLVGVQGKRSRLDEAYIQRIRDANDLCSRLTIMDARPTVNAKANKALGGGYESEDCYQSADVFFLDIHNIHVMRESLRKVKDMVFPWIDESRYLAELAATSWLEHVKCVMSGAVRVVERVHSGRCSCIIHCSDGWDRTAQLTSLSMLLLDPYYRTLEGFQVLIEKEWLSFGHKFSQRIGHGDDKHADANRSPVFLQWIDCIWQIMNQFPYAFEFNESLLIFILDHLYSCRFGTFLCNNEQEREDVHLKMKTVSIWSYVNANREKFESPDFYPESQQPRVLIPVASLRHIRLWSNYYCRWNVLFTERSFDTDTTLEMTSTKSLLERKLGQFLRSRKTKTYVPVLFEKERKKWRVYFLTAQYFSCQLNPLVRMGGNARNMDITFFKAHGEDAKRRAMPLEENLGKYGRMHEKNPTAIPCTSLGKAEPLDYVVQKTDTMNSIAAKFGLTPSELAKVNRLSSRYVVLPGQTLKIPRTSSNLDIVCMHIESVSAGGDGDAREGLRSPEAEQTESLETRLLPEPTGRHSTRELDEMDRECLEKFFKINVRHISDGQGVVEGVLLITPNAVMFDPNVSDPLVIENGTEAYGIIVPKESVANSAIFFDFSPTICKTGEDASVNSSETPENIKPFYQASSSCHPKLLRLLYPRGSFLVLPDRGLSPRELLKSISSDERLADPPTLPKRSPSHPTSLARQESRKQNVLKRLSNPLQWIDSRNSTESLTSPNASTPISSSLTSPTTPGATGSAGNVLTRIFTSVAKAPEELGHAVLDPIMALSLGSGSQAMDIVARVPLRSQSSDAGNWKKMENSRSEAKGRVKYRNMMSMEDKPELFASFDSQWWPVISYGVRKIMPEYWFLVPQSRVKDLYQFLLIWMPDSYGEINHEYLFEREMDLAEEELIYTEGSMGSNGGVDDESGEFSKLHMGDLKESWEMMKAPYAQLCSLMRTKSSKSNLLKHAFQIDAYETNVLSGWSSQVVSASEDEVQHALYGSNTDDDFIPELVGESEIFNSTQRKHLIRVIPARCQGICARQVFGALLSDAPSIQDHFYGTGESFLFTFTPLRTNEKPGAFIGDDGEFKQEPIFEVDETVGVSEMLEEEIVMKKDMSDASVSDCAKSKEEHFRVFKWSGENQFFIRCHPDSLAVGAGDGHFGLLLDGDLNKGRTDECMTFRNSILSSDNDFVIRTVECWSFD
ncbi:unnamed protein product [Notodromas monacha]|uniref:phosphatidylinositol-3,5-bisphosphate 3-phosphatase n=1 Tax=Notodromas monacha TaxID=399045 RepID=A0A7R9BDC7_9CRUS|nr:unnamed protein product [Notodromas monacha]CAG0913239.1 unnamed protein product [Notodromas monacha]